MQKYTATLTKNITTEIKMTSQCMLTGQEFAGESFPFEMKAGNRGFKTIKSRNAWIALMNKDHGEGTAISA